MNITHNNHKQRELQIQPTHKSNVNNKYVKAQKPNEQ